MTNITLSIEDETYEKMKQHSEIKWSEFVRKSINQKIKQLNLLNSHPNKESIMTMLASENVLKKDWDNKADERWNNV
jgi:predicted CopG family antitoxin